MKVDDLAAGARALETAGLAVELVDGALRVVVDPARAAEVTRILAGAGQWVTELRPERLSLEEVFLELTGGPGSDVEAGALAEAVAA